MGMRNWRKVDKDKLDAEFKKRGLTKTQVATELGYTDGVFSSIYRGSISDPFMKGIEMRFNIKYEDIKPDEPKVEEPIVEEVPTEEVPTEEVSDAKPTNFVLSDDVWRKAEMMIRRAVAAALQDRGL